MTTAPSTPAPDAFGRPPSGPTEATLQRLSIDTAGRLALITATLWPAGPLRLLQDAVGGNVERVALRGQLDAWVNEEGVPLGLPANPVATAVCAALTDGPLPPMLLGTVVFLRDSGKDFSSPTPVQQQLVLDAWRRNAARLRRPARHRTAAMSDTGWNRFNTDAHRTAHAACVCIVACAVDGATRRQVCGQTRLQPRDRRHGRRADPVSPTDRPLVFRAEEDPSGTSVMLVATYSATGEQLWHSQRNDEWPDETQLTDRLAAAWDWSRGQLFPRRDYDGLSEFTLAS